MSFLLYIYITEEPLEACGFLIDDAAVLALYHSVGEEDVTEMETPDAVALLRRYIHLIRQNVGGKVEGAHRIANHRSADGKRLFIVVEHHVTGEVGDIAAVSIEHVIEVVLQFVVDAVGDIIVGSQDKVRDPTLVKVHGEGAQDGDGG